MQFDYNLALMTGVDIPIPELQLILHQPTIKEISMLGERDFFVGIQLLCIQKNMYIEDETLLTNTSNFQIFMTMINDKAHSDKRDSVMGVLSLLLPSARAYFMPRSLVVNQSTITATIDEGNFDFLQEVLRAMFCLQLDDQKEFNPAGRKAKAIAEKLMRARKKLAEVKAQEQSKGSSFAQYLSVLTVGLDSMSLKDCLELTMYQLYNLLERYSLYVNWDLDIRSRLAGAKGEKPVENWMKPIH